MSPPSTPPPSLPPGLRPLEGLVPRWEWRTFGGDLEAADEVLATSAPERRQASDERYAVSALTDASVKLRDGSIDVKLRLDVDDEGLERWAPVLKHEFPLPGDVVADVLVALGLEPRSECAPAATVEEILAQSTPSDVAVGGQVDAVRIVDVHKERRHHDVDGCSVESSTIGAAGASVRTIAVEATDPALVASTVRRLGLAGRPNVNVPSGLRALAGVTAARHLVIDVGTNSVKYHLEGPGAAGTTGTLVDRAEVTRLGEGQADSGELAAASIDRTVDVVVGMVDEARRGGPVDIVAVGTAGLRRAPNRDVLVDAVRQRTGVLVEVISGADEARLAYLAATSALAVTDGPLAVFDSGGGSTQFTFGTGGEIEEQFSVDVGAVRIAERFGLAGAVSTETLDEVFAALGDELERLDGRPRPDGIVAIGGTATNLAAVRHALVRYDPDVVQGTVLDVAELDRQIELYRTRSADDRRSIDGLQPARAEVILGGACIVRTILRKLGHDTITVSDRGLRHGVALDRW